MYIKDRRTKGTWCVFKTEEHKNRRKGEGLQFNTRSLRSAFLWNGELPLAEQARFKLQYEVQFSNHITQIIDYQYYIIT